MKKILLTLLAVLGLFTVSAQADVGDIAGDIYSTDIVTEVDGVAIKSYAIDGRTLIALEDLAGYGFNVYYNDNIRTVFVTKAHDNIDIDPSFSKDTPGEVIGHYYETDITAVVNGTTVIEAYAIDGKMVAPVELLGKDGTSTMGRPMYQMRYTYDNDKRLLSLSTKTDVYGAHEDVMQQVINQRSFFTAHDKIFRYDKMILADKFYGGLMGGKSMTEQYICLENGIVFNLRQIASHYDILSVNPIFSPDGTRIYFKNHGHLGDTRGDTGFFRDYKQIDPNTMHITPLDEDDYQNALQLFKDSDYSLILDGHTIPLYNIGSADCVKVSDLVNAGYTKEFRDAFIVNNEEYVNIFYFTMNSTDWGLAGGADDIGDIVYEYNVKDKVINAYIIKENMLN